MQRLPRILSRSEKRVKFLRFSLHVTSHMQRKSPCLILLPSEAGRRSQTDNNPWRDALHQQEVIDQQQLRQHAPHAVRATAATAVTVTRRSPAPPYIPLQETEEGSAVAAVAVGEASSLGGLVLVRRCTTHRKKSGR